MNTLPISALKRRRFEMTGGSGVIIRRPSVAESLRILLGEADCDGALGVVEMALSPGVRAAAAPASHARGDLLRARRSAVLAGWRGGRYRWSWHMGMRAQGRTPHAGKLWNRRRATPLHVCTRWFRATLRADAAKQHGDAVLAELSEAERATRLIGPPLVSPAQPSRPDAAEFKRGAS